MSGGCSSGDAHPLPSRHVAFAKKSLRNHSRALIHPGTTICSRRDGTPLRMHTYVGTHEHQIVPARGPRGGKVTQTASKMMDQINKQYQSPRTDKRLPPRIQCWGTLQSLSADSVRPHINHTPYAFTPNHENSSQKGPFVGTYTLTH